jgi:hypothetical protein
MRQIRFHEFFESFLRFPIRFSSGISPVYPSEYDTCVEFVGIMWAICGHGIIQVNVSNAGLKLIKWASGEGERNASIYQKLERR